MQKWKILIGISCLCILLAACGKTTNFKAEKDIEVQNFQYTNHKNKTVTLDDLQGKPWLALFIFTSCTTVCQPMMANMADIQDALKEKGIEDYRIVGFSVDPEVDTPKKLANYLKNYKVADESKWDLLTGYTQQDIEKLAVKSFQTLVKKTAGEDQVTHGTTFALVNQQGHVVKTYSGFTDVPKDEIVVDVESIIQDSK
ncbi:MULTISPECIES: SCO family protein [Kurthia]|uniref:SCO family protein n=1 Tax=Kurthia TaxID=1649 RepID=UPI0011675335|nr:SCO family protein [Kurthia gibsonii]GED19139.1 SCO1 protein [Kurthia gibsonii]